MLHHRYIKNACDAVLWEWDMPMEKLYLSSLSLSWYSTKKGCVSSDRPTDISNSTEQNISEYKPNNDLIAIDSENVAIKMLVIIIYENEKFLGNVIEKKTNQICILCLEKLLRLNDPQDLERDVAFFNFVFKTNIKPVLTEVDANS